MRAIDKFILHVVHNWKNRLNEAYSEGAIKAFIKKFSEEADDLNITISDNQLRKYIERFDTLKNSPKITEKDLNKYSIGQLIKLVTSSPGAETAEDEEDRTPDVVYQDGGITIWNGSKEDNCIRYGAGESWCITRTSWASHRYSADKGYPTFYLAKNNNLSDSNNLSFIVIAVRDPNSSGSKRYVLHNRTNRPHYPDPISFSELLTQAPWLRDIPNIESILKYIKLSNKEKANQVYEKTAISIREWNKLPFNVKKQYLVARKNKTLFEDVADSEFVEKYLPKYPELASFIATTPGIIDSIILLRKLDKFNNQDRRSITANLRDKINIKYLSSDQLPFDVKKLLVILDKWNIPSDERMYVAKDGTIVKLKFGGDVSVGLYTEDADYPNIKLNQRTAKYLLEYPELDKLPFNNLLKLATDGVVNKEFINKVIEKAKSEENSAIVVKKIEDGEILIDANSFSSYKIKDDKITKVPFSDEEVQSALEDEKENTAFQQGAVNIIKDSANDAEDLPSIIDKDAFISIVKSTPYDKRTIPYNRVQTVILVPDGESEYSLFVKNTENIYDNAAQVDYGRGGRNWTERDINDTMDEGAWRAYFNWMRNENKVYEGSRVIQWLRSMYGGESKRAWFRAQPPMSPTDQYATAVNNGVCYLVDKANPRASFKVSDSGKLVNAILTISAANQLVGATPDQATPTAPGAQFGAGQAVAAPIGPRRGRPAGQPNAPRAAEPVAGGGGGDINVAERMQEVGLDTALMRLPRAAYRRLTSVEGNRVNPVGDRGAARRNNLLGARGSVGQVIEIGPSKIYIIRLANQQIIASINIQPGNSNYVLLGNENGNVAIFMNSPSDLLQVLQQRNLAEVRNYIIREYIANNPQHLDEVKEMLRKHIAETKK
jgi:hypothetical protein